MKKTLSSMVFLLTVLAVVCASEAQAWTPLQLSLWPPAQVFDEKTSVYGLRLNVLAGRNETVSLFDVGLILNESRNAYGFQVAGFFNAAREQAIGAQLAVFGNSAGRLKGVQVAAICSGADSAQGMQVSGFVSSSTKALYGIQVAGLMTHTASMNGMQLGLYNEAVSARGLQIGLINSTDTMAGVQIGLLNVIRKSPLAYMPIMNVSF